MNTINPSITMTRSMTQSGNGIAFGMRASGACAPAFIELPCAFAGSATDGVTHKRHVDVAFEHHQGTLVWSPPT